jgi:hypothetical protein
MTPGALATMIFTRFGINSAAVTRDTPGHPFKIVDGQPIWGLLESAGRTLQKSAADSPPGKRLGPASRTNWIERRAAWRYAV